MVFCAVMLCAALPPQARAQETVKIGLILPMTGGLPTGDPTTHVEPLSHTGVVLLHCTRLVAEH